MARRRVLLLVRPAVGGIATHVLSLALGLDRQEFSPVLVAPEGYGVLERAREQGLASYGVRFGDGLNPWQDRKAVARIREIAVREGTGLVHSHGLKADLLASLATRTGTIKHIATVHTFPVRRAGLTGFASRFLTRYVSGRVGHYIAVSQALAAELTGRYGVDPEKVSVVPNGLAREKLEDYSRQKLVRPDPAMDGPVIGSVGRLVLEKGMEDFIRAARLLRGEFPQARFWIVGDGPLRARLQALVSRLGLEGKVSLLGYQAEVAPWLAAMDVFVTCPVSEGFSLVTLEAMASGKPVVATATGGLPELIRSGVNGLLVPVRDPAALARAVSLLLRRPDVASELAVKARQHVCQRYTAESMAKQTQAVYERVLRQDSSGGGLVGFGVCAPSRTASSWGGEDRA
ncbi:MAG: glycosyltransferase family 1 protein [Clostridia bacterium]|nr:MAG: glycosyltransferase family 1 protein [Clostridia bacterium]